MNDTKIASKAKAQLANFMGKVFTHFSKPSKKFVEECIYGIQASGDTKLSSIVRAIDDDIRPIYTEKRLSRNLDDETLEASVAEAVLRDGARSVRSDTLLLVDPTENGGRSRLHRPAQRPQRPVVGRDARGPRPCRAVHDAALAPRHVRFARKGMQRARLLRRNARETSRPSGK